MVSEGYSDGYKQSYIGALSAVYTKAAGNFGGAGGSGSGGGDDTRVNLPEVTVTKKGFLGKAWDWIKKKVNKAAEKTASSVVLVGSSVVMPIINQASVIANEGIHEGGARDPNSKVSWAVPYKIEGWKFVRKDGMMKENLNWEDGKELMKSTTNVLMMVTPIKYDMSVPGVPSVIINKGASMGTKTIIKNGVEYTLDDD